MVLTDVFRKFTQKQPVRIKQDPQALPDLLERARDAALEFLTILRFELLSADGSLHAGTMLSAAGWLAGTSLHRSFNFQEVGQPGTVIKSDEINREWESLIFLLEQYNFQKAEMPVGRLVLAAMGAPEFFRPEAKMSDVQTVLQGQYNEVMRKHGFDYVDGSRVGVLLCTILIQQYSQAGIIDVEPAAGIAAQRIYEAAVTVPPELKYRA